MEPANMQLKKIMCKHQDDDRKPEDFPSQAIRLEVVMQNNVCLKGYLQPYYQVQIDHSAN